MMARPHDDERLTDWVDGRMSERELERFEAELRVNPQLAETAADYRAFVDQLRTVLRDDSSLDADTPVSELQTRGLTERIMAGIEGQRGRRVRITPLMGSLLAAAALVLAFFGLRALPEADPPPAIEHAARAPAADFEADEEIAFDARLRDAPSRQAYGERSDRPGAAKTAADKSAANRIAADGKAADDHGPARAARVEELKEKLQRAVEDPKLFSISAGAVTVDEPQVSESADEEPALLHLDELQAESARRESNAETRETVTRLGDDRFVRGRQPPPPEASRRLRKELAPPTESAPEPVEETELTFGAWAADPSAVTAESLPVVVFELPAERVAELGEVFSQSLERELPGSEADADRDDRLADEPLRLFSQQLVATPIAQQQATGDGVPILRFGRLRAEPPVAGRSAMQVAPSEEAEDARSSVERAGTVYDPQPGDQLFEIIGSRDQVGAYLRRLADLGAQNRAVVKQQRASTSSGDPLRRYEFVEPLPDPMLGLPVVTEARERTVGEPGGGAKQYDHRLRQPSKKERPQDAPDVDAAPARVVLVIRARRAEAGDQRSSRR